MGLFVVGVLVATVLFADRLGPAEELQRRFYQVGLAFAAALFVVGLAAVLVPAADLSSPGGLGDPTEEGGGVLRERESIIAGAGLLLLVAGLYQAKAYATISIGFLLTGLLLLISSATDTGGLIQLYYQAELDGGEARNAVYAAVTGIGLAVLVAYGLREWDRPALSEAEEAE
jgi:hypothetical protein